MVGRWKLGRCLWECKGGKKGKDTLYEEREREKNRSIMGDRRRLKNMRQGGGEGKDSGSWWVE